jgi:2-methylcitrate dehydratase
VDVTADQLVDFAAEVAWDDLTEGAIRAAKRSMIDSIGCAFGSYSEQPIRQARQFAATRHSTPPATLIGSRSSTTPELAALVNGAMIRYLDFSDDYFGGTGDFGPHPSDNIGGLLATTECEGLGGRDLILAVVIAYEAVAVFVDSIDLAGGPRAWDYPVFHAIATALGASRMMGLGRPEMHHALGLAVTPNFALNRTRRGELSTWKAFAGPNGSSRGLFAALLARAGLSGPTDPIEGQAGLFHQLGQSPKVERPGHGEGYKIEQTFYKSIPVRYTIQLPVSLAIDLHPDVELDEIAAIDVHIAKRFAVSRTDHPQYWDPRSRETADHSPPYLVAATLVDGAITTRTFTPERYRDPRVLELVEKVQLIEDPEATALFPGTFKVRIDVRLHSGQVISREGRDPKGHPANPMSDEEIESKFTEQAAPLLGDRGAEELARVLWDLDSTKRVADLFPKMVVEGDDL